MMWRIQIDQLAASGKLQRYDPVTTDAKLVCEAVEEALETRGLLHAEVGHYQITVTELASK